MEDDGRAFDERFHQRMVADVPFDEPYVARSQRTGEIVHPAADQIIDSDHIRAAALDQEIDNMRADETGASSHEHAFAGKAAARMRGPGLQHVCYLMQLRHQRPRST